MNSKHTLIKILNDRNIKISDKKRSIKEKIDEEDVLIQVDIISDFYTRMDDVDNIFELGLSSEIGKNIEEFKVWNKRGKFISQNLDDDTNKIIELAEESVQKALDSNYLNLIERSMYKHEISIGKPFENNIWRNDDIEIYDISKISFNLLENDCIKYIMRFRKKGYIFEWDKIITSFVKKNNLNNDSYQYIKAMIDYPYDSMKNIQKMYLKDSFEDKELLNSIRKVILKDNENIILS